LREALTIAGRVVSSRAAKPILRNVRLGDGLLTATDLEVRIDIELDYEGEPLLLPHDRLAAIVNAAQGDKVTLKPGDTSCVVTAGRGRWTLPTEDASEFPVWEVDAATLVRLPCDQFARAVGATVFAADTESSRYALGAVMLHIESGNPSLIATDGRRLSVYQCETDQAVDDAEKLVPARVMAMLAALAKSDEGSVQFSSTSSEVVAEIGNVTITARLLEGRYPRWNDVFPARDIAKTEVNAGELLAAVRQAAIVVSEQSRGVSFAFGDGITLVGKSSEYGESKVKCGTVADGVACTTRMDPHFVADWLRTVDTAEVVSIDVADSTSAIVFSVEDSRYVVMPMVED
jgi:DNA polymerase-3 subunit beta